MSASENKAITDMIVNFCLAFRRRFPESDLRHQDIQALRLMDGVRTVGQVGRTIGVKPAQMSRIIRKLLTEGLIRIGTDPDDFRKSLPSRTAEGERAVCAYDASVMATVLPVLEGMPAEAREALVTLASGASEAIMRVT